MNGSFNAYLLPERPRLRQFKQHVTMKRKMVLEDDIKEFWGFYLLRGSKVRLSVCSRHEGASFILVKGLKDARRCSYLGELDSAEESDEISEEFEFNHEFEQLHNSNPALNSTDKTRIPTNASHEAMTDFMAKFKTLSDNTKQVFVKKLLQSLGQDPNSEEKLKDAQAMSKFFAFQVQSDNQTLEMTDPVLDEEPSIGGEVFDDHYDDDPISNLMDKGRFDQKNPNDKSREETRSSWSSSEEALSRCEGLIYNVPLNGNKNCSDANDKIPEHSMAMVDYEVPQTGFYYFIFANENEITANFMRAHFDMHKTVFDVSPQVSNCTNTSSCTLPLKFWSEDHVVLEIPESDPESNDPCYEESLIKGYSSYSECNRVIIAESVCQPRKPVFMVFILLVPVMILMFAYI